MCLFIYIRLKSMFIKGKFVIPAMMFLGVVILLVLMFSTDSYIPYSKNDLYHDYSDYEGFAEGAEGDVVGNTTSGEIMPTPEEKKKEEKKEGFEDRMDKTVLGYSPLNGSNVIDKFSHIEDSPKPADCYSAGLSNSKGPMCLTPELVGLLKTRGNNM